MISSYIKTSSRNILRNKLFSFINIVGLAISMSIGLMMIAILSDIFSYDKLHEKRNRIYRVISQHQHMGNKDEEFFATTSLKAAMTIKESIAAVEDVAIMHNDFSGDVMSGDKTISLSGFWANESLFNVFSFELLKGNPAKVLSEPFSVVLTEKSAQKLFGHTNVLGKTITLNKEGNYTITGLLKDIPAFSHIKFEMLGSLSTRQVLAKDSTNENEWTKIWDAWAYVLVPENADLNALKGNLDILSAQEQKTVKYTHIQLDLQPLSQIMTGKRLSNQIGPTIGSAPLWFFACLSFIVILSASSNYTNLSIASSFKRFREVGIRKTIGALRSQVANQFIVESIIIAMLSLIFSLVLFLLIKPHFLGMQSGLERLLVLDLSPGLVSLFIVFGIAVGALAGFFPAIFFARINALQVLKNLYSVPALKRSVLRKSLIVFQYSTSIIAITATLIIYNQYQHFTAYDLGFTTENILNIRMQGNKAELLKNELRDLPEVEGISQSMLIMSIGTYAGTYFKNADNPADSAVVHYNFVDENYLPMHDHKLIAGQNFTSRMGNVEETEVIVNEAVLKRFNIGKQNALKAINETVTVDGKALRIIGVIKNFEYEKPNHNSRKEVIMRYSSNRYGFVNVKILSSDWLSTYAKIEAIWKTIDNEHVMEAKFYDEQIEEAFQGVKAATKLGGIFAVLVICISSIGLLGMVVFTTESRIKEICIRKVFGAGEARLLYLLSKGFLLLLMIAIAIAIPFTYLFFEKIALPKIANHAPLQLTEMFIGVLPVMLIALLMIGLQTLKVVRTNPAQVLKIE